MPEADKAVPTTTGGHDAWDKRTHIERINDWDNPAATIDVGEFPKADQPKSPKPKE